MPLSEMLFLIILVLFLAMVIASVCRFISIPYTVLLVILGLILNVSQSFLPFESLSSYFHLTHELVLFVFLPTLIFEAALSLDARALLKNLLPILVLAIPGLCISMLLVGLGLWVSLEINLLIAILFGALISATDPVAVVALFKELGVPRRLMLLVEGESLFNDATAIVLFNILLTFALSTTGVSVDSLIIIPEFFKVFLGGALVGGVISLLISELMVRSYHGDNNIPVVFSITIAYLSFIIAEHFLHVSGVMAVLTAAICLNMSGLMRLSNETSHNVHGTWEVLVLICNSLLFILIGLSVDFMQVADYWQSILLAMLAVILARAVSVYLLLPITTRIFSLPNISYSDRHVMWWGGLKGALAIAIVLSIPDELAEKQLLIVLTTGVVLVSLLVNATTIRSLIHWLKIDRLSNNEWAEFQRSRLRVKSSVDHILQDFTNMEILNTEMQHSVEEAIDDDLKQVNLEVAKENRLEQVHLSALNAEMGELNYLHSIGMINYYTFLSFKDVLLKDRERAIYMEKDEFNRTAKNQQTFEKYQKNIFVRLELRLIRLLSERNWAQGLLIKYQDNRFSNRIQHDIAGILMANEGLKEINSSETFFDLDELKEVKDVYQHRLQRRQKRLKQFKTMYPEFYSQFEYFLFQQVALKYSLKLINEEYHANKITAKVYYQLQDCLQAGLKQLLKVKTTLRLSRPDDWINKVPLFAGLPKYSLKQLSDKAHYINFLPEDIIFNENDYGNSLYILMSGQLNVFKLNAMKKNEHIALLSAGSFVGEHALLKNTRRSATVRAKTYVTLLRLTAKEVIALSKASPELKMRLEVVEFARYNDA